MDDVVLKPCPFCGGEAEVYNYYDIYMRDYTFPTDNYIKCKKCGANLVTSMAHGERFGLMLSICGIRERDKYECLCSGT